MLKFRYCYVLVFELLLPILIILAFSGIKGVLKPVIIKADTPGSLSQVNSNPQYQAQVPTLADIYSTGSISSFSNNSLPQPCSTTLAWYCAKGTRKGCNGGMSYTFPEAVQNCIPRKIAIVASSDSTKSAAQAIMNWGNAQIGTAFSNKMKQLTNLPYLPFQYYGSVAEFSAYLDSPAYSFEDTNSAPIFSGAVVLNSAAPAWDYTIRLNQTYIKYGLRFGTPPTDMNNVDISIKTNVDVLGNDQGTNYETFGEAYVNSGYMSLTDFVNSFILSTTTNGGTLDHSAWAATKTYNSQTTAVAKFPNPQVQTTGFWGAIGPYFALVLIIVLLYPLSNVVASLVREKETKLREGMMMMAMRSDAMMISWWFNFICLFLPLSILLTIVGTGGRSPLFQYSTPTYIFFYFFTFFLGSTAFCVLVSCFFTKSRTASIVGSLLFFGGYFIYVGLASSNPTRNQVLAACLHPAAALTYGTVAFAEYEDSQIGITQYTWNVTSNNSYTFQDVINMMFIDTFWMSFLAWYVDKIWPSEFGTQKPWYFVFLPSYWLAEIHALCSCLMGRKRGQRTALRVVSPVEADGPIETASVEMVTENLTAQIDNKTCVDIVDLYKEFDTPQGGKKTAVNKLNLTMYSGQITALLGHNGAGKTTTIAMLTGLIPPDGGTAIIEGFDINEDMDEIRRNLGVCPQHDILFPDLTVEEHRILFASFKGTRGDEVKAEVEKMIQSVGLTEKRHVYSKFLSGGQKRKLSVGIAFIGGSRIVFLDEPTSGMDPYSRRFTWNIISQHREGRVIVLTTHFMDEADLLGDRIAIMGDGKLACCGSSLFLKRTYGVGYNMTLEKKHSNNFDTAGLNGVVTARIAEASMITDAGKEITYQLPFSSCSQFPTLFEYLDGNLDALGLESYGISITTLEEVFIKITKTTHTNQDAEGGREKRKAEMKDKIPAVATSASAYVAGDGDVEEATWKDKSSGRGGANAENFGKFSDSDHVKYFFRHFYAMIIKRALYFARDRKAWIFTLIIPFFFLLAGMLILKYTRSTNSYPLKQFTPSMYNEGIATNNLPTPYSANTNGAGGKGTFCSPQTNYMTSVSYWYCSDFETAWPLAAMSSIKNAAKVSPMLPVETAQAVYNMSSYLWQKRASYKAATFGAYVFAGAPSATYSALSNTLQTVVQVNYTALHAAPLFQALLIDGLVRSQDPAGTASVSASMKPFDFTARQSVIVGGYQTDTVVTFLLLAVPFVPAAIATWIVREREVKAKHQQIVSGVGIVAYWLSTFLWDQMTYMMTLFLFVIVICGPVFGDDTGVLGGNGAYEEQRQLFGLLYLFGFAMTGLTYVMSFAFISPATAQIVMIFFVFITGLVLSIIGIVLRILEDTRSYFKWIRYLFCLFPPYALGDGLHSMALIQAYSAFELTGGAVYSVSDWQVTGLPLMMLGWESVFFLAATIVFEYVSSIPSISGVFARLGRTLPPTDQSQKDADVLAEEARVAQAGSESTDTIVVKDFKKMYSGGKYAVKGVSLGIPNGECFGLLGINGAGKSTTLSMLSGEFPPTTGEASLAGLNLLTDVHQCRRKIGFCPQFDSIFELLTGREHLELYARIKGINTEDIPRLVEDKIREMGLTEYASRYAGTYSGGNKRKLSVAIAMIGEPSIVFLDEPSTGMDPVARRFM